jgi:hypothetical protein
LTTSTNKLIDKLQVREHLKVKKTDLTQVCIMSYLPEGLRKTMKYRNETPWPESAS